MFHKYILLKLLNYASLFQAAEVFEAACFPSLQLLDCFGIPVLMALSWFILRARYKVIHFVAVFVCLLGVGTMVGADILAGREDNSGETVFTECIRSCFQSGKVTLTESGWWRNSSEGEQGSMLWASVGFADMLPQSMLLFLECAAHLLLNILFGDYFFHLIAFSHLSIN